MPSARLAGLELSIIASINVDDVDQKRYAAVEFLEYVSRIKARRGTDISPYIGLAKQGNRIHALQIFSPPEIVEQLSEIPDRSRKELIQTVNSLGQEFGLFLIKQFLKGGFSNLPDSGVFEDMQRSMLCQFAGNIEVVLSFCWRRGTKNGEFMTHVIVSIFRYFILCSRKSKQLMITA